MVRFAAAVAVGLLAVGGPRGGPSVPSVRLGMPPGPVRYHPPLPAPVRVLTAFDPPADPYGPGHLGVDLAARADAVVSAAGPGIVRFAGPVAGRGVVVIEHPDGIRTEYEPVHPLVEVGATVLGGDPIGRLAGRHPGCAPHRCLHWGARRGTVYLDPMALLGRLGPVRLLPLASIRPRDG